MIQDLALLREKFDIRPINAGTSRITASGNRLQIPLPGTSLPLVIRCHSMYMTLRYGAEILRQLAFHDKIGDMEGFIDWQSIWNKLAAPFEQDNVPETWCCLYYMGKPIFSHGKHHMFIDIIEQCEFKSNEGYDQSIVIAKKAFHDLGRPVMIDYQSHSGFSLDKDGEMLRAAITMRVPGQTSNFIIRMSKSDVALAAAPTPLDSMALSANYIEATNMAVRLGFIEKDFQKRNIDPNKDAEYTVIKRRLYTLKRDIDHIEQKYRVYFRPDRPNFDAIIESICEK